MIRPSARTIVLGTLAAAGAYAFVQRSHRVATGRSVPGGVLMADARGYDVVSRLLFGPLFRGIAADVGAVAPDGAAVLEVGCGPGLLSTRLAGAEGLVVTGLDLDPAMIDRARANAERVLPPDIRRPSFVVDDVAALPFDDGSFDLVVSTFAMHHWSDRAAGLTEIARVLRPGARALIWDLKPGSVPFHPTTHDHPTDHDADSPLGHPTVIPWRWPGPVSFAQRIEFVRA